MSSKLGTAFDILSLFERPTFVRLTLGEVAEALGVAKSTASTTLRDLAAENYLTRDGDAYVMGPRFQAAFANAVLRSQAMLRDEHARVTRSLEAVAGAFTTIGGAMTPTEMAVRSQLADAKQGTGSDGSEHGPECGAVGG